MSTSFDLPETTIGEIHDAMASGEVTSRELVERYLDRIEAYDRDGPELNAFVTVNPEAKERADELDEAFAAEGFVGPMHGIPVLMKDQAMTAGLTTTFGSEAFAEYVPERDAKVVSTLKDAGAIILGKTNLPDWAAASIGYSSVLGQTKNPYAPDRDPGGSSAGTAAGVAANLGTIGIGEDTGGSIRVPSSRCNLFGIRVTTGLISRDGMSPLITRQDTAGPMGRTVEDVARVLDVIAGHDPADGWTGVAAMQGRESYLGTVETAAGSLEGARLGVLEERFGDGDSPVRAVTEQAVEAMVEAGAELVEPVSIPDLDDQLDDTWLYGHQSKHDIDAFLAELADPPVGSFDEIYSQGRYHPGLKVFDDIAAGPSDPGSDPEYYRKVEAQHELRRDILNVFAAAELDAIVFPDIKTVPPDHQQLREQGGPQELTTNTYIAPQSGCPAMSVPGGFTDEGFPVGVELLGTPHSEHRLLELAADYESATDTRQPPSTTPEL